MSGSWLHERFAAQAAARAAFPAVLADGVSLSYAELDAASAAAAAALQQRGVGRGDVVGLQLVAGRELVTAMLAVLRAGAAYLVLDPAYPAVRLRQMRELVCPALVIAPAGMPDDAAVVAWDELARAAPAATPAPVVVSADDTCYIMFTSGTSGTPNAVRVLHGNVANLYAGMQPHLQAVAGDCWSALHSPSFGYSTWEIWGPLTTGATLCIVPAEQRADPQQWDARVCSAGVTVLSLTPSGLRQWLAAGCTPGAGLRLVVLSGEPLREADLLQWFARVGDTGPQLLNTYALTETAGRVLVHAPAVGDAAVLGAATADAEVSLRDPVTLQPVEPGATGELFVAGPMIAAGYIHNAVLTRERFVELPGSGRAYRTGDLARLRDDGCYAFAGRADAQLKLRGFRIEPAEIETVLEQHPQAAAAAVIAETTPDGARLHAFVEPAAANSGAVEFWPSLGEYQIYDALLYDFMSADETRVAAYRRAFERQVAGRVVLDIGTGQDAILARQCVAAGARHVYAVEVLDAAADTARELVASLGLADRITVLRGAMADVELPEPVEVCTQGIVGNIGSSDGIAPIWNDARRHFASGCVPVPQRCTTYFAPASLPGERSAPRRFGPLAAAYTQKIFAAAGKEFDVRLCVRNFPREGLLAGAAVFEDLDFRAALPTAYDGALRFTVARDGWLDGYLLWTRLETDAHDTVDFFAHQQAWLPVWFPLGAAAQFVRAGTVIEVDWQCRTPAGQVFPDYRVTSRITADGAQLTAVYESRHFESRLGATPLHRELLANLHDTAPVDLRAWAADRLPAHMVPAEVHYLAALPLSANNKLDRKALHERLASARQAGGAVSAPAPQYADALEQAVAAVWARVLEKPCVGAEEDFFACGGDSITAVRLTTEIQRWLDDAVFLAALYEAPAVRSYARWLREHHATAVERAMQPGAATGPTGPVRTDDSSPAPLSWAQQSLYFLQQLYPDNTAANEQFLLRLDAIEPARLAAAWDALLTRHDILRTHFAGDGSAGDPFRQVVTPARPAGFADHLDLRDRPDAEAALRELAAAEIRVPFELRTGPLLRPVLVRLAAARWGLLVTAHHTVADGLCVPLINAELCALYSGAEVARGLQFADYARWQQAEADAGQARELAWWRDYLHGVSVTPVDALLPDPDPAGPEARIAFTIDPATADALRALARAAGTTLFVTVLALWRVWLARAFRRHDFLVGSPATLRTSSATARVLGCMVNNVAFRNALALQHGFRQALRAERDSVLAALDHSALPFEKIVEDQQPPRVFGRHPLFQFMFQFAERDAPLAGAGGSSFATDVLPVDRASYWDMELSVTDAGPQAPLEAFLGVRSDLFDAAALREWPAGFMACVRAVVAEPDAPLQALPLLSSGQLAARAAVNATGMAVPQASFLTLFAAQAARTPDKAAVRHDTAVCTYAELRDRALTLAAGLAASGVGPGDIVGVHLARGSDAIALLLAINGSGAAWLPLDTAYPRARLEFMLREVRPTLVVGAELGEPAATTISLAALAERGAACGAPGLPVTVPDTACVLYTSGSTGQPKGIRLGQRAALGRCLWMWQAYGHSADEIFAQRTSLNFVDVIWECCGALLHGATVSVAPAAAQQDMAALARWVAEEAVTHLLMFPSGLGIVLNEWEVAGAPAALRSVITTGEPVTRALVRRFAALLPDSRLINTYGTSENWDITTARLDDRADDPLPAAGFPVANTTVHVLDDMLQPLPAGVRGDLYVGGAGVADGYIDRPELTAERFVRAADGTLLFRTGDLAAVCSGNALVLHGRADRQLKLRGVRIEPGEIEALATALPAVREAAVLVHGDTADSAWLALYLVAADNAAATRVEDVRAALAAQLPRTVVPAEIVMVPALPHTPSGKLDSAALAAQAARLRGAAQPAQAATALSPVEARLAAIWCAALGVAAVGRHDNFFALRGNSLLATRVIARICDEFGLDLPLACLFESPTLAELARSVEALQWAATAPQPGAAGAGDREVLRL